MDILAFFHVDSATELAWVGVGFAAQLLFGSRFLVQWFTSERAGESVIPVAFWWLSLFGGMMMLCLVEMLGSKRQQQAKSTLDQPSIPPVSLPRVDARTRASSFEKHFIDRGPRRHSLPISR